MTKLLQEGIAAVSSLSAERQDLAGMLLLHFAGLEQPRYTLTSQQIADLNVSLAQADRGEFATDDEMDATWTKFGL